MNHTGMKNICLMLFLFCLFPGLNQLNAGDKFQQPIEIFVSILPQAYFVEQIGGSRVSVDVLVAPGKSPATYMPTPEQMARLSKAKLFFRIGVPFEEVLIPKIKKNSPNISIIDTRKGIRLRSFADGEDREFADDHHHEAHGRDPHIWLSPLLVRRQAKTICDAFIQLDPDGASAYRSNLKNFVAAEY